MINRKDLLQKIVHRSRCRSRSFDAFCQWLMRCPVRLWRLHSFTCLSYSGLLHTFYSRWVPFGVIACLSCNKITKLKQGHKNTGGKIKSHPNECPQSCWHIGNTCRIILLAASTCLVFVPCATHLWNPWHHEGKHWIVSLFWKGLLWTVVFL